MGKSEKYRKQENEYSIDLSVSSRRSRDKNPRSIHYR